jgi:hypothetical protein
MHHAFDRSIRGRSFFANFAASLRTLRPKNIQPAKCAKSGRKERKGRVNKKPSVKTPGLFNDTHEKKYFYESGIPSELAVSFTASNTRSTMPSSKLLWLLQIT